MRVLLLEDEDDAAQRVRSTLAGWPGASLEHVVTADDALRRVAAGGFDVLILDRGLDRAGVAPDGLRVVERMRSAGNHTPVLVLSNLASTRERIEGRDSGADDYLTKPFDPSELVAVLRALMRRAAVQGQSDALVLGSLDIRVKARTVHWNHRHVDLSPKEFEVLRFLAENQDVVVSREMIWRAAWPENVGLQPQINVIDVALTRLRTKLNAVAGRPLIETVRKQGYVLRSPLGG